MDWLQLMLAFLALVLPLVLFAVLLVAVAGVRDEIRRQTDVIETIGRNAGWLPQRPPKP